MLSPLLTSLPAPSPRRLALHITPAAERSVRQGHPWLFDESITRQTQAGEAGDLAVLYDKKDRFLAIGLYDPDSPVRVKILHQGSPVQIDAAWFEARLTEAARRRDVLAAARNTGYRVVHGENDGLPGLIVDRYATCCVIKLYTAAWLPYLSLLIEGIVLATKAAQVVLRLSRQMQAGDVYGLYDGAVLYGETLPAPLVFMENGLRFAVDVVNGHKTGFFCDQRDNRARVRDLARGRRVLDVFAYVGAFSLYAADGGASAVTSLDVSAPALAAARANFALNQSRPAVAAARHETLAEDAFDALTRLHRQQHRYEMVIVDPPTFAGSAAQVSAALEAYTQLARLAVPLVARDGVFVMASCSSRISADTFFETVLEAAWQAGVDLDEIERTGHALDHPITFPEGAYLKCLFAKRMN